MLTPFWVQSINNCMLGISPCPSSDEMIIELTKTKATDSFVLISLLTNEEQYKLGLENEASACQSLGIEFLRFPIADTNIPNWKPYLTFLDSLNTYTYNFDKMLIHCRAGIGRSSLILLGLLVKNGAELQESINLVKKIRGFDVPQSSAQKKLLSTYYQSINLK
jgi:protein-tyrosine phosphatase